MNLKLHPNFCVDTSWKAKVLEAVDRFGGCVRNVDKTFMNTHFKCFTTLFIHVWTFYNGKCTTTGRKWDGSGDVCTTTNSGVNNLLG